MTQKKHSKKGAGRGMSRAHFLNKDGYLKGRNSWKLRRNQRRKIEIIATETPY